MNKRIRLLMLEDSKEDAEIVRNELAKTGLDFIIKLVDSKVEFERMLEEFKPEIILSDYLIPGFNGLDALNIVKAQGLDIPYIFVSGHIGEDLAIEALHRGATDYVLKDKLTKLVPTITRVLKERGEQQKRKIVEVALKESEEKFRTIVNNLNIVLFILDRNGIITFAQGRGLKVLKLKADKIIGTSILKSYGDLYIQMMNGMTISGKEAFQKLLQGETIHGISTVQGRYQEVKLVPEKNSYNEITNILGIANDITELIRLNEKLKESEERYRNIYESAPIGILSTSSEGKFINANPVIQQILGYNEKELQGLSFRDVTFSEDINLGQETLNDLYLNKKDHLQFEKRYIKKNKEVVWANVIATAIRDAKKKFLYAITMIEDISKRKKTEEELIKSEKRYRLLFERNLAGVFSSTLDGRLFSCNQAFVDIFGFNNQDEIYNTPVSSLYQNSEKRIEFTNYLQANKIVKNYEIELKKKDGKTFWALLNAEIVDDLFSENQMIQGTMFDITDRKKVLEEIIKAKEKVEEADKLKAEFLAQMSHEIRTPLNIILSYSSFLKEQVANFMPNEWSRIFNAIDGSGKRLVRTIDLILNMSMIQTGKIELSLIKIDLNDFLIQLLDEFTSLATTKNIDLKFSKITQNTICMSDEYVLTQIFMNLFDNAIKYTKEGYVEVLLYRNKKSKLCVTVRDTGIGISAEYLSQMFKPFTQEETGYSRRYEGVGLGLALVKNYLNLIKGRIEVESIKDKGSAFTVIFN